MSTEEKKHIVGRLTQTVSVTGEPMNREWERWSDAAMRCVDVHADGTRHAGEEVRPKQFLRMVQYPLRALCVAGMAHQARCNCGTLSWIVGPFVDRIIAGDANDAAYQDDVWQVLRLIGMDEEDATQNHLNSNRAVELVLPLFRDLVRCGLAAGHTAEDMTRSADAIISKAFEERKAEAPKDEEGADSGLDVTVLHLGMPGLLTRLLGLKEPGKARIPD